MQETWVQSLGWEDPLEKGKVIHSCSGLENTMDYTAQTGVSNFLFHFLSSNRNSCPFSEQLVCSYGMDNGSLIKSVSFSV